MKCDSKCRGNKESFSLRARHRLDIKQTTLVRDNFGGESRVHTLLTTTWAIILPKSGSSSIKYQQIEHVVSAEIIIRYDSRLANITNISDFYIEYENRQYDIVSILNLDSLNGKEEGKKFQKLICKEGGLV